MAQEKRFVVMYRGSLCLVGNVSLHTDGFSLWRGRVRHLILLTASFFLFAVYPRVVSFAGPDPQVYLDAEHGAETSQSSRDNLSQVIPVLSMSLSGAGFETMGWEPGDEGSRGLISRFSILRPLRAELLPGVFLSPGEVGFAGDGSSAPGLFLRAALDRADSMVDFSLYDNDGPDNMPNSGDDDGVVDLLALAIPKESVCGPVGIKAGSGRYSETLVSGGEPYVTSDPSVDGGFVRIENYTVQPLLGCDPGPLDRGDVEYRLRLALAALTPGGGADMIKILASDLAPGDTLGNGVSTSGNMVLVGSPRDDDAGDASGTAYVFERTGVATWVEHKLLAGDAIVNAEFGVSVAISGDTAVVGVPEDAGSVGAAYVFVRVGGAWVQEAKLIASDGAVGEQFGISVAIEGDTVAVGAHLQAPSGAVYVFGRVGETWVEEAKLTAPDASKTAQFGISVLTDGDTIAVGAPNDAPGGTFSGSTYVFEKNGGLWSQEAKLTPGSVSSLAFFGIAVSLDGERLAVGAFNDNASATASGSVFVFESSGAAWGEVVKLDPGVDASLAGFGAAVSLHDDRLVVGAPFDDSATAFDGKSRLARHRAIHGALGAELISSIHALSLDVDV